MVSFKYVNGVFTRIETFPDSLLTLGIRSQAFGINDSGLVVGTAFNDTGTLASDNAFIYDNGSWTNLGPGTAYAINASGERTGKSQAPPMKDLGHLALHTLSYSAMDR